VALSLGVKWPGHEAAHSPPSSAEVKAAWSYASTPQYIFMAWCLVKHRYFTVPLPHNIVYFNYFRCDSSHFNLQCSATFYSSHSKTVSVISTVQQTFRIIKLLSHVAF